MKPGKRPLEFLDRVAMCPMSGCWIWTGVVNPKGYGRVPVNRRPVYAHRRSWFLHVGVIPSGMQVLHRCDVPACVNPAHLFLGTHNDNMRDKMNKGRAVYKPARGSKHGHAKLTERDVIEIRRRWLAGERGRQIAAAFRVHKATVSDVICGRNWSHV